jgi:2-keto-4-pentenoate hydratase/2-oxohepta-3-ene-1,7-dioic acid hydratase in catechol pathway
VNGEVVQRSSTEQLIFSVPRIIEHLSAVLPLLPGDVVYTGTPAGVGGTRTPPRFLQEGDVVETSIGGIGDLRQICVTSR